MKYYYYIDRRGKIYDMFDINRESFRYGVFGEGRINGYGSKFHRNVAPELKSECDINEHLCGEIIGFFELRENHLSCNLINTLNNLIDALKIQYYKNSNNYLNELIAELIFEKVRLEKYSDLPSRFNAIFLCDDKQGVEKWLTRKTFKNCRKRVYRFEIIDDTACPPKPFVADVKWFDGFNFNHANCSDYPEKYWGGDRTQYPCIEILFYGVLKCAKDQFGQLDKVNLS